MMKPFALLRAFCGCLLGLALVVSQAVTASAGDETAKQFLEKIYRPYIHGNGLDYRSPAKSRLYFDRDLNALFQKDRKEAQGEVGRLDFDPFVQAQDFMIAAVRVTVADEQAGRAKGTAAFINAGHPVTVDYDLVRTPGGWRIANIVWPEQKSDMRSVLSRPFP